MAEPSNHHTPFLLGPLYAWRDLPHDIPPSILEALGGRDAYNSAAFNETVKVIEWGTTVVWPYRGQLILEDHTQLTIENQLPGDLPMGYHHFMPEDGRATVRVIVTPGRCLRPEQQMWGWAAQLHSAHSAESWGLGDLADLRRLAAWSAQLGASVLMVNPLVAAAPTLPQNPSPYYPTSRRFRNPIYLRIENVPGAERLGDELHRLAALGHALNTGMLLDRDKVYLLKQEALSAIWADFTNDESFDRYCNEQARSLEIFALYCALAQRHGANWRTWPVEFQRPDGAAVAQFARDEPREVRYHQWLQWLLDRQLAEAGGYVSLVQDLPIGIDSGGADAWEWQDLLAAKVNVGAPPDAFNSEGQNWGLPPFIPTALRAARYEPFIQTIRATLRHSRGLRIDHVMGLFRLWWIPQGEHAQRGWYVRYPADDLLGIVALESRRAGSFVVGEDLGTVEPGVRERLAVRNILSCRVLWFEPTPPQQYPELSMATVTTHDLPTIAGLWSGADAAAQQAIGLLHGDEMLRLRKHLQELLGLADDALIDDVIERAYQRLAESPSLIVMSTLEDAQAMPERPNMPGTITQWPNWSLRLPQDLATMEKSELPRRIARALGLRDIHPDRTELNFS